MSINNHKPIPLGPPIPSLIGSSPAMEAVYRLTRKVAATNSSAIAASNKILCDEVDSGRFREDLYWRLNVVPIVIPPLRMRREDIQPLITHFLAYYGEENEKQLSRIHPHAMQALQDYHWPG